MPREKNKRKLEKVLKYQVGEASQAWSVVPSIIVCDL